MSDGLRASVVIGAYNAERYVERAIRSALQSDLREIEVIVIDDGSTDRTPDVLASIGDSRLTVVRQSASGGPSRPRNVGIARARAPYIAFLDADDLVKPWKLSAAVSALDRRPEPGFAFTDFERIDVSGDVTTPAVLADYPVFRALSCIPLDDGWSLVPQSELARGLLHENFVSTSGVLVRKHLLHEIGLFDETLTYSEDRDLWFRLAHACGALYSSRIGHSYRVTPTSLTYGPSVRNARHRIIVLKRERARWQERVAHRQLDRLIAENLAGIGYALRLDHRRLGAAAMFARAFVTSREVRWLRGLVGSLVL